MGTEGEGISRSEVMVKGALAAAAVSGLGAVGPYVRGALAATDGGDLETLNFLLPFEYLQAGIYARGMSEINAKGEKMKLSPEHKRLIGTLLDEERRHIAALVVAVKELGGKPAAKGSYAYAFREVEALFRLAGIIEHSAIQAYNGAIPSLESKELRELAGSIVQVEGRHIATLLIQGNEEPAPEAFDKGVTEFQAMRSVEKFTGVFTW